MIGPVDNTSGEQHYMFDPRKEEMNVSVHSLVSQVEDTLKAAHDHSVLTLQSNVTNIQDTHAQQEKENAQTLYQIMTDPKFAGKILGEALNQVGVSEKDFFNDGGVPKNLFSKFVKAINSAAHFHVNPSDFKSADLINNIIGSFAPNSTLEGGTFYHFLQQNPPDGTPLPAISAIPKESDSNTYENIINSHTVKTILGAVTKYLPDPPNSFPLTEDQKNTINTSIQDLPTNEALYSKYSKQIEEGLTAIQNAKSFTPSQMQQLGSIQSSLNQLSVGKCTVQDLSNIANEMVNLTAELSGDNIF